MCAGSSAWGRGGRLVLPCVLTAAGVGTCLSPHGRLALQGDPPQLSHFWPLLHPDLYPRRVTVVRLTGQSMEITGSYLLGGVCECV